MVSGTRVTVDTTADLLANALKDDRVAGVTVVVLNRGSVSVFLGGSTVTATTGFELEAGASLTTTLYGLEALYGITATGSARVDVLVTGSG